MTSAPIGEMNSIITGMLAKSVNPSDMGQTEAGNFSEILGNVSDTSDDRLSNANELAGKLTQSDAKESFGKAQNMDASRKLDSSINNEVKEDDSNSIIDEKLGNFEEQDEISQEELEIVAENLIAVAADILDEAKEVIAEALEELDVNPLELNNDSNIALLVSEVKGDGDMMNLVVNEDLSNLVKELGEAINVSFEELASELEITTDQLTTIISDELNKVAEPNGAAEVIVNVNEKPTEEVEVVDEVFTEDNNDYESVTAVKTEVAEGNEEASSDSSSFEAFDREDFRQTEHKLYHENSIKNTTGLFANDFSKIVLEGDGEGMPVIGTTSPSDIMNQVLDTIKTEYKAGETKLQMQLNPENLGTVNLSLAAREGNVTASFTTQNEAVRAALESQIVQLRENLEAQGVKVSAVEVTVASHGFEQNLENGNDSNEQQEEVNAKLRKETRKLNFSGENADEYIEGLDENEQVTAKMMQADGNTMDYRI